VLELCVDGDHPLWFGHLHLEVGVVGDCHELVYVVLPRISWYVPEKLTTSKVSVSMRKLLSVLKLIGMSICPSKTASIPGMTPWK
jgi:hypothetical protein